MSDAREPNSLRAQLEALSEAQIESMEARHAAGPGSLSDDELQLLVFRDYLRTQERIKAIELDALKKRRSDET